MSKKICITCGCNNYPRGTRILNTELSYEIDGEEFAHLIRHYFNYCWDCNVRLFYIRESDDPSCEERVRRKLITI